MMRRALRIIASCLIWAGFFFVAGVLPTVYLWSLGLRGESILLLLAPAFVAVASMTWMGVLITMEWVSDDGH